MHLFYSFIIPPVQYCWNIINCTLFNLSVVDYKSHLTILNKALDHNATMFGTFNWGHFLWLDLSEINPVLHPRVHNSIVSWTRLSLPPKYTILSNPTPPVWLSVTNPKSKQRYTWTHHQSYLYQPKISSRARRHNTTTRRVVLLVILLSYPIMIP